MDFTNLITVADWVKALSDLINQAQEATSVNDRGKMTELQNTLFDFQQQSPAHVESLDIIAAKISLELNKSNTNLILKNLSDLNNQLKSLTIILDAHTAQANEAADAIQLKNVKTFLDKTKTSLNILVGLRDDLQGSTELSDKVIALLSAIRDFENAFA